MGEVRIEEVLVVFSRKPGKAPTTRTAWAVTEGAILDSVHLTGEAAKRALGDVMHSRDPQTYAGADVTSALDAAVSAIYFADSSDYLGYLWSVVRHLDPNIAELLERDERAAYDVVRKRLDDRGQSNEPPKESEA